MGAMKIHRTFIPECMNMQVCPACQDTAELGDVYAGAPVNLGRKLFRHNIYTHSLKVVCLDTFVLV